MNFDESQILRITKEPVEKPHYETTVPSWQKVDLLKQSIFDESDREWSETPGNLYTESQYEFFDKLYDNPQSLKIHTIEWINILDSNLSYLL